MSDLKTEVRQSLLVSLRLREADRLKVYDDATGKPIVSGTLVKGNPTIGIGRNLAGKGISEGEAQVLEEDDINDLIAEANLEAPFWSQLTDGAQASFFELGFNLGFEGLRLKWPHFWSYLATGQYDAAANEITSNQVYVDEVGTARAAHLAGQVKTGSLL